MSIFGPGGPFQPPSSTSTAEPRCHECNDTGVAQLYFLKPLNNPSRLYVTATTRELCPYCNEYA